MSSHGKRLINLIKAGATQDRGAFTATAQDIIADERRKNHHVLADQLERALTNGHPNGHYAHPTNALGLADTQIPRDTERGTTLVEIRTPQRLLETLVLDDTVQASLQRILDEQDRAERLRSYGLRPITKVLFCGPPGCGKTVAAEALAQELYLPLVLVRFDAVVSSYLGETAANLRKVLTFATTYRVVMLFDEFDAIGKHRTAQDDHGELKRVVNAFLQLLDGFRGESLLIAATNHQGLLDPALWRRFDEILWFDRPDAAAIMTVFQHQFRQFPLDPTVDVADAADHLSRANGTHADAERIAHDAIKQSIVQGVSMVTSATFDVAVARQHARIALTRSDALHVDSTV